jgi:superfamily II DNA or RNA helicase
MLGYIYVRQHPAYDIYNVCKLGKTMQIPERDSQYATPEFIRGEFILVVEMSRDVITNVEKMLQNYFKRKGLHLMRNGGTEFFKITIIEMIIPYLRLKNINFRVLSYQEIKELTWQERIKDLNDLLIKHKIKLRKQNCTGISTTEIVPIISETIIPMPMPMPRPYQEDIITMACMYYETNYAGLLSLICGTGKTLISLWIAQRISAKKILIGVPNKLLLKQWARVAEIMFNFPLLLISGGTTSANISHFIADIDEFIIITTYASAYKIASCDVIFDMKILDEVHHLTGIMIKEKSFLQILQIASKKQLGLTATLKHISSGVSNDSIEHFGNIITSRNLHWAINAAVICDYELLVMQTSDHDDMPVFLKDRHIYLSAYIALKCIYTKNAHHILIYSNTTENAHRVIEYIKQITYDDIDCQSFCYHSSLKNKEKENIIAKFTAARFGIISCVYCLGEGWDFPLLDAVVFSENMTSNIRIVQSALRASRKNPGVPDKIAKIILPIIDNSVMYCEDYKKIREIIYQMSLEDENIIHKIKAYTVSELNKPGISASSPTIKSDMVVNDALHSFLIKTITRDELVPSYEQIKKIVSENYICNKEQYYESRVCDFRLPECPEEIRGFKGWIDFLGIKPDSCYELVQCVEMVKQYITADYDKYRDIYLHRDVACGGLDGICKELCTIDAKFPPYGLWTDFYMVPCITNCINFRLRKKKKISII